MTHPKDTRPTLENQLVFTIKKELREATRRALSNALDRIELEIDRLYPPEKYANLLDPRHDWSER